MSLAVSATRMPASRPEQSRGLSCDPARIGSNHGFSLPEVLLVVALIGVIGGVALPQVIEALQRYRLFSAGREVAAQIRSARLAAVTTNRVMIVRFNCPAARQYRFIEVTGNAAIDTDPDRCAFPPADSDPATLPNSDGLPAMLPDTMAFGATQDLQIGPTGLITPLAGGMPALIQVTNGTITGQITVSATGRVQMQ
ncbi:MAG: prepilin-type N-terminal cleavage/methylation domain-containing protein [Vicinamibacterales bacterium]